MKTEVKLETKSFTIPFLDDHQNMMLEEMWMLSCEGHTPTQISYLFNIKGYRRKYSDQPFTHKDIGMMKLKYKKRLDRSKQIDVNIGTWCIEINNVKRGAILGHRSDHIM